MKTKPDWAKELERTYVAGISHAFVLYGNVRDYAVQEMSGQDTSQGASLRSYLPEMLKGKKLVVFYDRLGFTFPKGKKGKGMEKLFADASGSSKNAGTLDPALSAALGGVTLPTNPEDAIPLLDRVLKRTKDTAVIIQDAHLILGNTDTFQLSVADKVALMTVGRWGRNLAIQESGNIVILVSPALGDLHGEVLQARFTAIELPMPDEKQRTEVAQKMKAVCDVAPVKWGIPLQRIANALAGLTFAEIREVIKTASSVILEGMDSPVINEQSLTAAFSALDLNPSNEQNIPEASDLPRLADRLAELVEIQADYKGKHSYLWKITPSQFGRLTSGLQYIDLEDLGLRAAQTGSMTDVLVMERKETIMQNAYDQTLVPEKVSFGFNRIGAMGIPKRVFQDEIATPIRDGDLKRVPQGVLMMGAPGTGKSLLAKALAYELGFSMVRFDPAKIKGQYVGNTEKNLDRFLAAIVSFAPVVCFMDEVDQIFSRSTDGNGGVDGQIFGRLLEFMADPDLQGRVIFVAATNRPDLLDAAMLRPGRMDILMPFFPPDAEGRDAVLKIEMGLRGFTSFDIPKEVIDKTDGWTGADLGNLLAQKALSLHRRGKADTPGEALLMAIDLVLPATGNTVSATDLALRFASDLEVIPEQYHARVKAIRTNGKQTKTNDSADETSPAPRRGGQKL